MASVVVADLIGLTILTGLATLDAHSINANPLRSALFAAAANGLANTLRTNSIKMCYVFSFSFRYFFQLLADILFSFRL